MPPRLPYLILTLEVALFFRLILWGSHVIPWDLRGFFLPHTYAIADALRAGEWPLWDPSTYCGRPLLANIQMGALYPPVLLTAAWGALNTDWLPYLLQLNVILHILAGGIFAYWLGLALGLNRTAALYLGTVFCCGGFFAAHASHMTALQTAIWFPFTLWAVLERRAHALTFGLAMSVLAGLAPLTAVVYAFAGLAALATRRARWFVWPAAAAVVLSLCQLVPTVELTNLSIAQYRADYLDTGGGVPLAALASLLSPNFHGVFDLATYRAPYEITFIYLFCGWTTLALAAWALLKRTRLAWIWLALTLVSALAMLGDSTPLGAAIMTALPVKIRIGLHPEYVSSAFTLCLAALAALGLQSVPLRWQPWLLALAASELIAVSSARPMNAMDRRAEPGHTRREFNGQRETLDKVRGLTHTATPPWRIDTAAQAMPWAMTAPMTTVPSANGNDPFALVNMQQARLAFLRGERWGSYYEVENTASPALSMMNVRYLITGKAIATNWPLKTEIPGFFIYENPRVLPRFWLVSQVTATADHAAARALVTAPDFAPWTHAIVEGGHALASPPDASARVNTVHYGFNSLELVTQSAQPSYLVTSEAMYPGWTAWVDGQPATLHTTNVAFRGLYLPAGRHRVEMRFRPWSHIWSGAASLLGGLAWAIIAGRGRRAMAQHQH